jgi:hypothetical protein
MTYWACTTKNNVDLIYAKDTTEATNYLKDLYGADVEIIKISNAPDETELAGKMGAAIHGPIEYNCPKCGKPLTFNYVSDKVLDLNDTDFIFGKEITPKTTYQEMREMEFQPATILYCEDYEIDVLISPMG